MTKRIGIILSALTVFLFLFYTIWALLNIFQASITGFATTADVPTYLVILNVTSAQCNFTMEQGWNLVSIPCLPQNEPVDNVTTTINTSVLSIHSYTPGSADPWNAYNPSLPWWVVNDLVEFDRKKGYWINLNESAFFYLDRGTASPNVIGLSAGWNLVGYPTMTIRNINDSLANIYPNYLIVYRYNTSADSWFEYNISAGGNLYNLSPYQGYWVQMNISDTWIIDW
ncbi:hypothetical protein JW930_07120 [Candidatus Woesearchaeota archaeon]|nr:hypothetical protein [Candidatus Woesearchaeota archaeon]